MKLPAGDRAILEIAKLRDYCLDPNHPRGRHKARMFQSLLGLTQSDAAFLRNRLLEAARSGDAVAGEADHYGERYQIDFPCQRGSRQAVIRSAWIILHRDGVPRLTSCYVLLD